MLEGLENVTVIGILFMLFGVMLLLPKISNAIPKLFPDSKGHHRFVTEVKQTVKAIGIGLFIVGSMLLILQLYFD